MQVIIMGCGRVGSTLADSLDQAGHSVTILDQDSDSFRKLPQSFGGRCITGVGFDRDVLELAGIKDADAFAAVSSGDNSNIISARIALEKYNIKTVVARIYDPKRAEIYQRLGISTVASVAWTTAQIAQRLQPVAKEEFRDSTGTLSLAELQYHPSWIGRPSKQLQQASGARIGYINRFGLAILPDESTYIQDGDIVHAVFRLAERERVMNIFASEAREVD